MSARAKILVSWLWIAALLTATVGISVHKLYCYCVDKTTVSLFAQTEMPDDCCSKPAVQHDCCSKLAAAPGFHKKCSEQSVEVLQLRDSFLSESPSVKAFDCPAWLAELPMFKRFLKQYICEAARPRLTPPSAAPPLAGRALCQRYQVFRI